MESKSKRSLSLLAWGLNEELLIETFLNRAFEMLDREVEDSELIFVDDGSTDETSRILSNYAKYEPRLKVITNRLNMNVGLSCRIAIEAASKEILFWQTVEWSFFLINIGKFLSLLDDYDVVQGIRPVPIRLLSYVPVLRSIYRVKTRSDSLYKAVISLANYYLLRILFGVQFQDFQNITFYRTSHAKSLHLKGVTPFVNPELLIRTYYQGCSFIEVPIPFIPRTEGEAKGTNVSILFRTVFDIVKNWLMWGYKIRFNSREGKIDRVSQPFKLPLRTLQLVLPTFSDFQ